jgi:predicted DNA-binding protein (UPF0251 family)
MSNKLKELIAEIQFRYDLTQDDIAKRVGYSRPYLTDAIKKGVEGKILDKVQREFPEVGVIPIKNTDLNKQIGIIEERLIRLEAYATVLIDTVAQQQAAATGQQQALIKAQLQEALTKVLKHSLDELRKKT